MTVTEVDRAITGGVDTHLEMHMAAALDPIGGLLGVESFPATPAGYRQLLAWMTTFGAVVRVGVEGTGADKQHLLTSNLFVHQCGLSCRSGFLRAGAGAHGCCWCIL